MFAFAVVAMSTLTARADECPVLLASFLDAGRAASGSYSSYHVRVTGPPGTIPSLTLRLRRANGSESYIVDWNNVKVSPPSYEGEEPNGIGTFDKRTSDVIAATIERVLLAADGQPIKCSPSWVSLGTGYEDVKNLFGVVNDTAHAFDPRIETRVAPSLEVTDADFVYRAQPVYPPLAQQYNEQGNVTVRITIDEDGKVSKAVIWTSGQSDFLDLAALDAVHRSKFKPPLVDGKRTKRDYLVIYEFMLDGLPPPLPPSCPMTITKIQIINGGPPSGEDWYTVGVASARADITSAVIGMQLNSGKTVGAEWPGIALDAVNPDSKKTYAEALLPWAEEPIRKAWIDSIVYADGSKHDCSLFYAVVDTPDASQGLRSQFRRPVQLAGTYSVSNDPPVVVAYPAYPAAEVAASITGQVGVYSIVDRSGNVSGAFVSPSSGNADLDAAALAAAMKNRYAANQIIPANQVRLFYVQYSFTNEPW